MNYKNENNKKIDLENSARISKVTKFINKNNL